MGRYILEAIGEHAKQRVGGANLLLWIDKPVLLGRAVKDTEGYKFPNHWNSLSSKHCKLVYQDGSFEVEDTSTNGTFINGQKVGRGNKAQLHVKDTLGLSLVPPTAVLPNQDFVNTVEYRLEYFEQTPPPADQQPEASPALLAKRRHSGSPATVAKRPRTDVDAADLLQLKAKNDELRQLNDGYRARLDELDQQLQAAEASKQETAAEHAQQLKDLEAQVRGEAAEEVKRLQDGLAAEKQCIEELNVLLRQQQASAAGAESRHKQELEQLQTELQEQQQQLSSTTAQLQSHQHQLAKALASLESLQSDLQQQLDLNAAAELSASDQQQKIEELSAQQQALQQQLQQAQQQLTTLRAQLQDEQAARAAAETREREALMKVSQAERVAAAAKEQFDSKKEEVMLFNAQAGQIQQQLEEHGAQVLNQFNAIQTTTQAFAALLAQLTPQQAGLSTALTAFMDSMGSGLQQMQVISKPGVTAGSMNGQEVNGQLAGQQQQQQQQHEMEGVVSGTQAAVAGHNSQQTAPGAAGDAQQQEDAAPMTQPAGSGGGGSPASSRHTAPLGAAAGISGAASGGGVNGGGVSSGSAAEMPPPPDVVMSTPGHSHNSQQQQEQGEQQQQSEHQHQQLFSPGQVTQDFAALQGSASVTKTQVVSTAIAPGGSTAVGNDAGLTLQLLLPSGAANSDHIEAAGHLQQQTGMHTHTAGMNPAADIHASGSDDAIRQPAGQVDAAGEEAAAADTVSGGDRANDVDDEDMEDAVHHETSEAAAAANTTAAADPAVASLRVGGQGPTGDTLNLLLGSEGAAAGGADGAADDVDEDDGLEGAQGREDGSHCQLERQNEAEDGDVAASEDVTENPDDEELGPTSQDCQQQQQQEGDGQQPQEQQQMSGSKQLVHQQYGVWGNGVGVGGSPAQRPRSQPALGDIINQQQAGTGGYMRGFGGTM